MPLEDMEISPDTFRQRQAWAYRNGKLDWLWPDIAQADWRGATATLEAVVRGVLSNGFARLGPQPDLAALSLAAYTGGVGPLIGYWIECGMVAADPAIARLLAQHLDHNRRRMAALAVEAGRVAGILEADGIPVTVLKGMHLAFAYFSDPGTRPLSDVDLLIAPGDRQRATALLAANGFACIGRNHKETTWAPAGSPRTPRSLLHVHAGDPWSIDLHHSVDQQHSAGLWKTSLDRSIGGFCRAGWALDPRCSTLAQPALLLQLAAHIGAAVRVNSSLLRLVDLVLVIRQDTRSGALDWDAFLDLGAGSNSLGVAFPALALTEKLIPGTVPPRILQRCAREAPPAVRRWMRRTAPAEAQRLDRLSLRDHYMWTRGPLTLVRQIGADLVPGLPLPELLARYARLARRALARGFIR